MEIKICKSLNVLLQIARLRYDVYSKELGKTHIKGMNHQNRTLSNEMDFANPILLYAKQETNLVGTLRYREVGHLDIPKTKYNISSQNADIKFAEVDFFIVRKQNRSTRVSLSLACHIYYLGLMEKINICLIEVELHLEKFYLRLGFRKLRKKEYDFGSRIQMYLNLYDIKHLKAIKSPFVKYFDLAQKKFEQFESSVSNQKAIL